MSTDSNEPPTPRPGQLSWMDLTIPDADAVSAFYHEVVGWKVMPLSMGDYDDYVMTDPATDAAVAGVCHARGVNSDLPPQWLLYITVDKLEERIARCKELGGEILGGIRSLGASGRFCVIRDPAGAVMALHER